VEITPLILLGKFAKRLHQVVRLVIAMGYVYHEVGVTADVISNSEFEIEGVYSCHVKRLKLARNR
jgi:hypothetical protein